MHPPSLMCCCGMERKQLSLVVEETKERVGRVFLAYATPITEVPFFNYLGRILLSSNNNWPAVEQNLRIARGKWGRLAKILGREGVDGRMAGKFYVAVGQAVLLFGSETWVLTSRLEKSLNCFHFQAMRHMSGMGPKRQQDGVWVFTPIGEALVTVGLEDIGVYITLFHNTVAQYIVPCPIMDLYLAEERKPVLRLSRQWWEQPALDIL